MHSMDLCDFCLTFVIWLTVPMLDTTEKRVFQKETSFEMTQKDCKLCQIIFANLSSTALKQKLVYVEGMKTTSRMVSDEGRLCKCEIAVYSKEDDYEKYWEKIQFALWADQDSIASRTFITRLPLSNERPEGICDLGSTWLRDCGLHHSQCSTYEETHLPTRVLDITGGPEEPTIRLMETYGMKGYYCALSHCWGAPEEQPIKTTRATLQSHLSGIPFRNIPKTFQEAIFLARGIGIQYVWIDSLCIIQNDPDWNSEAKEMGRIYRDATLVIAAAGATNSKEGLIFPSRAHPTSIRLPYISDETTEYSINMSVLSQFEERASHGPLGQRAWAFQEWYLARRLLFFMPGGLTWKCNTIQLFEQGNKQDLELYEQESWSSLLESYTQKKLTYHTDRLEALRGIISELQKNRTDHFRFDYAVWEDQILEQILWRRSLPDSEENHLELPTWSWARTGDSKQWVPFLYGGFVQYLPRSCELIGYGTLCLTGHILGLKCALQHFSSGLFEAIGDHSSFQGSFENSILPGYNGSEDSPAHLLWDDKGDILGIAVFDDGTARLNSRFFLVASTEREQIQSPYSEHTTESPASIGPDNAHKIESFDLDDDGTSMQIIESNNDTTSDTARTISEHELDIIPKLLCMKDTMSHVYWALLLEPIDGGKFKRVGCAMLYPHAYEIGKKSLIDLNLV